MQILAVIEAQWCGSHEGRGRRATVLLARTTAERVKHSDVRTRPWILHFFHHVIKCVTQA